VYTSFFSLDRGMRAVNGTQREAKLQPATAWRPSAAWQAGQSFIFFRRTLHFPLASLGG
jgi:hypothetical protein